MLPAGAQVTSFTPGSAEVRAFLARNSATVFAATYGGGLYSSANAGTSWSRVTIPNNDRYMTSLAGNSTTTIVVGAEEGLYTSTDGTNFAKRLYEPVTAVAMGAAASTTVLAAVKGLGILRSTNSGVTFTQADNGDFAGTDIIALAEDPTNASIFYASAKPDGAGNRGGIYKTTDGGLNWSLTSALPNAANRPQAWGLTVDSTGSAFAAVLEEVGGQGAIYKLTGGSGSWAAQGNTFTAVSVHRDANNGTTIWGGHRVLGLKRSVGGAAFADQFPNNGVNPSFFYTSINAVATFPGAASTALKAIKGAGVYKTTNAGSGTGTTWTKVYFPGADRILSATGVAGNASSLLMGLHAGGVWRSDTAGNASSTFNPPTVNAGQADFSYNAGTTAVSQFNSIWDLSASATNANWIWAATGNVGMHYANDNPGVFRWNGSVWAGIAGSSGALGASAGAPWNIVQESGSLPFGPFPPVITAVYTSTLLKGDDSVVFAGMLGSPGLHRRTTVPGSWAVVNTNVPGNVTQQIRRVETAKTPGNNRVIVLPFDDRPLISTDFGASFSQTSVAQGGFERLRFYQVAENPNNANNWIGVSNKGVYVSNNAGASWTRVAGGWLLQAATGVAFNASSRAFVADWAGNRYCSSDGGNNWTVLSGGPLRAGVNAVKLINGSIYYLTDGAGAFREDLSC